MRAAVRSVSARSVSVRRAGSALTIGAGARVKPLDVDNVVFFGSSSTYRGLVSNAGVSDGLANVKAMLADYGINVNCYASAVSGSALDYQQTTLMPQMITTYGALSKPLCVIQMAVNSVAPLGAYSSATPGEIANFDVKQRDIFDQAASAGFQVAAINFNTAPNYASYEMDAWNQNVALPIIKDKAARWASGDTAELDYYALSYRPDYLFSDTDGVHMRSISGDFIYRGWLASQLAKTGWGIKPKSLSGRRFVVCWGGTTSALFAKVGNVNRMAQSTGATAAQPAASMNGHLVDADTGEVLQDLYVLAYGALGTNAQGFGNAGNATNTYLNNTVCSGSIYTSSTTIPLYFEIGRFDGGVVPSAASITLCASRNIVGTDRKTDWTINGETKQINAAVSPCGAATWSSVPSVGGKITATGVMASGSTFSYLSGVEVLFA